MRPRNSSTHRALLTRPEPLAQNSLQYLARGVLRQLRVQELHPARNLVTRETPPAMLDEFVRGESFPRLQRNAGHHEFPPLRVGYSEDCGFANRRMCVNDSFHLTGINIFATGDDHVFQAIEDVEIALPILIADVSRAKHSVSKCESGVFRIVPVAPHDVGAPGDQFAALPDFHFLSSLVLDSQVNSRTGSPTR